MAQVWTIEKVLAWTTESFTRLGLDSPKLDAELLLAYVLGVKRMTLYVDGCRPLEQAELERYRSCILRRQRHEPIAYITENKEFWSLSFHVTPAVLIPRPDTECLVERVLEFIEARKRGKKPAWMQTKRIEYSNEIIDEKRAYYEAVSAFEEAREMDSDETKCPDNGDNDNGDNVEEQKSVGADLECKDSQPSLSDSTETHPWRIADVGTGSGAIALALASEIPAAERFIDGIDISEDAVKIARFNAQSLHLEENVSIEQGDLLSGNSKKYDIIVSNPPYIANGEMQTLMQEVKYEPTLALEAGEDGLDVYRKLVLQAKEHLNDNGLLIVEIGSTQAEAVMVLFRQAHWNSVCMMRDYAGLPRIVAGIWQNTSK